MISIIIPTLNEAGNIGKLITYLLQNAEDIVHEIIVVDGGSTDKTMEEAGKAGATAMLCPAKGRAPQMNYGASKATGEILYFIHADTLPPATYASDILTAIDNGYSIGRYRTHFDTTLPLLKLNQFFTRFDLFVCYGGDQTLFIAKFLFNSINGFDASMHIMEDYDIVKRARQDPKVHYHIIPKNCLVSARKYETCTWWQVQKANFTIVQMFKRGASQQAMVNRYKEMLNYR